MNDTELLFARHAVNLDSRFRERSLGDFEGWTSDEFTKYAGIPDEKVYLLETEETYIDGYAGVEDWGDFVARVWSSINDIAEEAPGERIFIVAHSGVLKAVTVPLSHDISGMPAFENGQVIRIQYDGGKWFRV